MNNKLLEAARQAFEAYIEFKRVEATYEAATAAMAKAKAELYFRQGVVRAREGDMEGFYSYVDAKHDVETKHQWAEGNARKANEEYNQFKVLSQAKKDDIAWAWYTREGQEKADTENEARCSSAEATWFEAAAYGRD